VVYHYLVTEFYRGMSLYDAVRNEGRFDLEDAVQITLCVLSGLSFIHSRALIHNDIRPSNIMLQELDDGMLMPTIIDLGHISYMVKGRPTFVDEDLMPYFRAPETFRSVYTVKSDIFSTGALLYFLMFGKSPWEEMDLREHMEIYLRQGMERKEAMKAVAKDRGLGKRDVYRMLLEEE
jgi:serine/threonine protein kinase